MAGPALMGENPATRLNVLIGMPVYDSVKPETAESVANIVSHFYEADFEGERTCSTVHATSSLLAENRHSLVRAALERDCTHILFVDSDMQLPSNTLPALISHNKAMVGLNYPRRTADFWPTAARDGKWVYTMPESVWLESVDSLGFGCVLIRTDVFDEIEMPMFRHANKPDGTPGYVGEDVFFCRKVKTAGIDIWVDHDLSKAVRHIGSCPYSNQLHWPSEALAEAAE